MIWDLRQVHVSLRAVLDPRHEHPVTVLPYVGSPRGSRMRPTLWQTASKNKLKQSKAGLLLFKCNERV
jgi:hypothetical protein